MKSAAIHGAANLLASASRVQGNAKDKVPEVDFSAFMSQASFQNQETLQSDIAKGPEKGVSRDETLSKSENRTEDADRGFDKAMKTENLQKDDVDSASEDRVEVTQGKEDEMQDIPEETLSKVSEVLSKVQEVLQDGFSMTEEELLSALENLGFTMADLMNPDAANACIQALSGAQDSMALLVDEQLYATCTQVQKDVLALTQVLGEEVQLTTEEMELILSKLEELQAQSQSEEGQIGLLSEEIHNEPLAEEAEIGNDSNEIGKTMVTEKSSVTVSAVHQDRADSKSQVSEEVKGEPEEDVTAKLTAEKLQGNSQESDMAEQNQLGNQNQPEMQPAEPTVQNVFDGDAVFTSYTSYDGSYESIIRQVAEQIRVQVTADTSSVEMQLNPESLGRLSLSVELKQGMLTAKFVAENEQVKEAIENQAVVLREDLGRQGLKVEAIEVAVETHEFERNLEQGQQQNQAEEEAGSAERQRSGRRNLNLDILEEEEGLTEAEDLAAKIMKENGNTMDYFA